MLLKIILSVAFVAVMLAGLVFRLTLSFGRRAVLKWVVLLLLVIAFPLIFTWYRRESGCGTGSAVFVSLLGLAVLVVGPLVGVDEAGRTDNGLMSLRGYLTAATVSPAMSMLFVITLWPCR